MLALLLEFLIYNAHEIGKLIFLIVAEIAC